MGNNLDRRLRWAGDVVEFRHGITSAAQGKK